VDFGAAGTFLDPASGRPRAASVFVMTLGYSRHQYAEIVLDQRIGTWLALHRRAFEWFGGVPRRIVPDNLKAAVLVAALHDPVLGEAYRRQAQHYGFVISPTRPRTPEHKGKVENGVHFVKRSFLAGQEFADLRAPRIRPSRRGCGSGPARATMAPPTSRPWRCSRTTSGRSSCHSHPSRLS
jgi:transposase